MLGHILCTVCSPRVFDTHTDTSITADLSNNQRNWIRFSPDISTHVCCYWNPEIQYTILERERAEPEASITIQFTFVVVSPHVTGTSDGALFITNRMAHVSPLRPLKISTKLTHAKVRSCRTCANIANFNYHHPSSRPRWVRTDFGPVAAWLKTGGGELCALNGLQI